MSATLGETRLEGSPPIKLTAIKRVDESGELKYDCSDRCYFRNLICSHVSCRDGSNVPIVWIATESPNGGDITNG